MRAQLLLFFAVLWFVLLKIKNQGGVALKILHDDQVFFFFHISFTKASEMKPGYMQSCNAAINNPELNKSSMNDN